MKKIWSNDLKVACKSPFNLIEFLEENIDLEEELEEFEGDFEKDEVVEVWKIYKEFVGYYLEFFW